MADYYGSAALLDDDEKKKQQEQQAQGGALQTGAPQTGGIVTGQAGGGQSGQALNNGGFGGWTNIQSYINANEGNDSSAKLLDSTVGGEFDKEKSRFDSESGALTSDAKKKADESVGFVNNFQNNLNSAASGNFNNDYANQAKSFLNTNFQAPQFTYSLNQNAQNFGNNLKDDNSFYKMQNDLYTKTTGNPLTTGQQSLQTQLDTSSDKLAQARNSALDKYTNYFGNMNDSISGVNKNLTDYQNQVNSNKKSLSESVNSGFQANNRDALDSQYMINEGAKKKSDDWYNGYVQNPFGYKRPDGREVNNIEEARQYQDTYRNDLMNENTAKNKSANNQWSYIKSILGA